MAKKTDARRFVRGLVVAGIMLALAMLGVLGWQWMASLRVEQVDVSGARHAEVSALLDLAQVDTGQVMLEVDPLLIADRVQRHPWVAAAEVSRLPTGTVAIAVQERMPVVLALDAQGRPAYYLDRASFGMPLVPGAVYDVPLLRGLDEVYHPLQQVENKTVQSLLVALDDADNDTDALISELVIEHSGEIQLRTTPAGGRGAIPVSLGRDNFGPRLARLRAFWEQAVLTQTDKTFALIDLRFNSRVVTREAVRDE